MTFYMATKAESSLLEELITESGANEVNEKKIMHTFSGSPAGGGRAWWYKEEGLFSGSTSLLRKR